MPKIGNDALGSDAAVSPRRKRLSGGPKSIPQLQKEAKEAKLRAIREEQERDGEKDWDPSTSEVEDSNQNAMRNKQLRKQREETEREEEKLKREVDSQMDAEFRSRKGQPVPRSFPKKEKKEGKEGRETRAGFI